MTRWSGLRALLRARQSRIAESDEARGEATARAVSEPSASWADGRYPANRNTLSTSCCGASRTKTVSARRRTPRRTREGTVTSSAPTSRLGDDHCAGGDHVDQAVAAVGVLDEVVQRLGRLVGTEFGQARARSSSAERPESSHLRTEPSVILHTVAAPADFAVGDGVEERREPGRRQPGGHHGHVALQPDLVGRYRQRRGQRSGEVRLRLRRSHPATSGEDGTNDRGGRAERHSTEEAALDEHGGHGSDGHFPSRHEQRHPPHQASATHATSATASAPQAAISSRTTRPNIVPHTVERRVGQHRRRLPRGIESRRRDRAPMSAAPSRPRIAPRSGGSVRP